MAKSVLVVDDSVIYRKTLTRLLDKLPQIGTVFQASNGKEAVRMFEKNPTDLVTMDIEMPLMTGLEALPKILDINKEAKVLMISSITKRGASYTIEALSKGAADFITKEQAFGLHDKQAETLGESLEEKIKCLCNDTNTESLTVAKKNTPLVSSPRAKPTLSPVIKTDKVYTPSPVNLLLIGSSTGGPPALQKLLLGMKKKRNYSTVIVQHMPEIFTAQLAQNLSKTTRKNVIEASDGHVLQKDQIVIAAGGKHLLLHRGASGWVCKLTETEPVNSCRPSVDVTFESVSKEMRNKEAVALIMTGMGSDGAAGCKALYDKNIPILTQEKSSCVVYGMPKAVDGLGITTKHATPPFLINEAEKFMMHPEQLS